MFGRRVLRWIGIEHPDYIMIDTLKEVFMAKRTNKEIIDIVLKNAVAINNEWHSIRSMLGHTWAIFYCILGARDAGKSYAVMEYFLRCWKRKKKPFYWLRLNEASTSKLLANNAEKLVDPDLYRKYGLELTTKGNNVYDHGIKMAEVLALSTFYNDKGVAHFDKDFNLGYNIALDEFQLEKSQKRQGDICYQFVNQMENLVRDEKEDIKIILIGNTLEEASDILTMFNFIPESYGRYKIRKKRCIIDYMPPSEKYRARRKGTVADLLAPDASTFTNEITFDKSLIWKGRLNKPTSIIAFSKTEKYTVWDGNVIASWNGENCSTVIAMRPYIDLLFNVTLRDAIIEAFDNRALRYRNLITNKKFQKAIQLIKPRKQ